MYSVGWIDLKMAKSLNVSWAQISKDVQLQKIDFRLSNEFVGQMIGHECFRRLIIFQIVTSMNRQTFG